MRGSNGGYIHGTDPEEQRRLSRLNDLLNERSLRGMDIHLGDRIVDAGCGLGQLTRAMARKAGSSGGVVGIERSEEQIGEARRQASLAGEEDLIEIRRGNASDLPLEDGEWGTFDIAHTRFVLEHVPDPERVVANMFRAVRPGGRVILEDDDHDVLRLSPEVPEFERLWRAYIETYRALKCDPFIGRRLVTLLRDAGAESTRNDWKFFGGCHGTPMFRDLVANFIHIVDGARDTILSVTGVDEPALDEGFRVFREWSERPDASMWYGTFWAEGSRPPGAGHRRQSGRMSTVTEPSARSIDKLTAMRFLAASARDLNSSLRLDEVYAKIAERVRRFVDYHLFCVMLWNERTRLLDFNYSLCFGEHIPLAGGFPLGHGLSGTAALERRPVRVDNVLEDNRYVRHRHPEVEIRSELVVPLVVRDRLVGVIDLESTEFGAFTEDHEQLISSLARHIAIAVDNARLHETVLANEERMDNELTTARAIQKGLLPSQPPEIDGVDIGLAYSPATALAGDFYDFLPLDDGRFAFAVGDVAGKATPAALYGSLAVGIIRGHALRQVHVHDPGTMLEHVNEHLVRLDIEGRFAVMAYGILNMESRELKVGNAGFPFPLLLRGSEIRRFDMPGLPLGVDADTQYPSLSIPFETGDVLVFCSDGFADCEDRDGNAFGEDRLEKLLRDHSTLPAREIAAELLRATDEHAAGAPVTDDRTAVIFRAH
jgi:serine phosphatase RsbU (regulator of sigma subunit)/ubiquinone/menaquinone biosynthesis C-methylase UbiE